jgi:uncharacterized protein (DUF58 family)
MNPKYAQAASFAPIPTLFIDPVPRFFLGVLLFLAFLFGAVDLAGFCLVVLLLSTGAKLWRRAAAAGVTCRYPSVKLRAFPGETLTFGVHVMNSSILPVAVRSRLAGAGAFGGSDPGEDLRVCKVGSRRTTRIDWAWNAPGRGVYRIGPPVVEAGDALGFFFTKIDQEDPQEIVVYPRLIPITGFDGQHRELFGSLRARGLIEDPVNLVGTRDYQPGSPARSIHWKASARLSRLQEKVFEPSRRARFLLTLDVHGFHESDDDTGFEEMLETAASIARHLVRAGAAVGAMTNARLEGGHSPAVPASRRPGQVSSILEMLARMTMEPSEDRLGLIQKVLPRTRGVARIHFARTADKAGGCFGILSQERAALTCVVVARQIPEATSQVAGSMEILSIDRIRGGAGQAP